MGEGVAIGKPAVSVDRVMACDEEPAAAEDRARRGAADGRRVEVVATCGDAYEPVLGLYDADNAPFDAQPMEARHRGSAWIN